MKYLVEKVRMNDGSIAISITLDVPYDDTRDPASGGRLAAAIAEVAYHEGVPKPVRGEEVPNALPEV